MSDDDLRPSDPEQASRAFDSSDGPVAPSGLDSNVLFEQAMAQTRMAVCITDPHAKDNPIIFANRAFAVLTGYEADEVIGTNCRFLQGAETDRAEVARLRRHIEAEEVAVVELLNYRKDGSAFWNALHIGPIYDAEGKLLYFFGSQWDVTDIHAARTEMQQQRVLARELNHRLKNLFGVIASVISLSARGERDVGAATQKALDRVMALGRAHEATLNPTGNADEPPDLLALIETVLRPYRSDRPGRIAIEGGFLRLPAHLVTAMGLALHELATNAIKHGALGREDGRIAIDWRSEDGLLILDWREEGPRIAVPDKTAERGVGSMMIQSIVGGARGSIEREWHENGLHAVLRLPLNGDPATEREP